MGYYQGDFYRGARGDPGFFSFLGGVARSFLGLPAAAPATSSAITRVVQTAAPIVKRVTGAIASHPTLTAAGAAGGVGLAAGALAGKMRGAPSAAGMASASRMGGGGGGKRRRMRVTNPKALRRALRRAYGFERLAMRTIHLLHPKKKGRFGGFRRPKKRAA